MCRSAVVLSAMSGSIAGQLTMRSQSRRCQEDLERKHFGGRDRNSSEHWMTRGLNGTCGQARSKLKQVLRSVSCYLRVDLRRWTDGIRCGVSLLFCPKLPLHVPLSPAINHSRACLFLKKESGSCQVGPGFLPSEDKSWHGRKHP